MKTKLMTGIMFILATLVLLLFSPVLYESMLQWYESLGIDTNSGQGAPMIPVLFTIVILSLGGFMAGIALIIKELV